MNVISGTYNGWSFGAGTGVSVDTFDGLDDLPAIRSSDLARSGAPGMFAGDDWENGRTLTAKFTLKAATTSALDALVDGLKAATVRQPVELPLVLNGTRQVLCRPRKRQLPDVYIQRLGYSAEAHVMWEAVDPLVYDANLQQLILHLPNVTGGMTFPLHFPLTFGSGGSAGVGQATNSGSVSMSPIIVIGGPCANPYVENSTAGQHIQFNLTLATGDTLTVDLRQQTATLVVSGSSLGQSRRNAMTTDSAWWSLAPGISTIRYSGGAYNPTSTMTLQYRSAWE